MLYVHTAPPPIEVKCKLKCTYNIIQNFTYTNIVGGGGGRTFIVLTFLYIVFAAFLFIVLQYIFQV